MLNYYNAVCVGVGAPVHSYSVCCHLIKYQRYLLYIVFLINYNFYPTNGFGLIS